MQKSYWQGRWNKGNIGFHSEGPDEALIKHWPRLGLKPGAMVAAPLCGKSTDLLWLRAQNFSVFGVEFVEQACRDFYAEQGVSDEVKVVQKKRGMLFEHDDITLQCADFMKLRPADVPVAKAIYDRAALVALPPEMRKEYVQQCIRLFPQASEILLISFEYDTKLMGGPPFNIGTAEIQKLYGSRYTVTELERTDMVPESEKYQKMGLPEMIKVSYHLQKRL